MKRITREHPKIDCIACPWLIRRFIDSNVEIIKKHGLNDPAVLQIAEIVRGADTDRFEIAPQAAGLCAVSAGLSYNYKDDHEQLTFGMKVYDALYSWAKCTAGKTYMEEQLSSPKPAYTIFDLAKYFLKLGTWGFGGPVALVGYMHRDLVENKNWLTEEEYKEGLALAQLAPGPLAAQLGIYIGFVHYRFLGATLAGLAFVLPSFVMVVLLGMLYQLYGGLTWMQAVFYGVGAAVIGIISLSAYKLTIKTISKLEVTAIKEKWLLWLFYIIGIIVTVITQKEEIVLFLACGIFYMLIKAPPRWIRKPTIVPGIILMGIGFWKFDSKTLTEIGWFFLKAGAFVFGSGLAIVPFLHGGVVTDYHWLNEKQFVDAVAVAMITPGPVVITVGFIGYLVAGFPGACVAALATFLPCYVFTVALAPSFKKIAKNKSIKSFVDGITSVVIGALVGSVIIIGMRSIVDIPTALIAIAAVLSLWFVKKMQEPYIIGIAAALGLILKLI